ncbi:hypothetical protein V6N11_064401 [Hibiscus sabdariffa]|uniref:RNase H type-1 domain-containing protein n=1 Tax=Hibiscus sabdariffa TaxID=183260 RepID=A0ABR2PNF3_9ROSI
MDGNGNWDRDCGVTFAVWQRQVPPSLSPGFYASSLQVWVINSLSSRVVHSEGGMPWPSLFLSTLWQLWKSHNDFVFNSVLLPIETIRNRAITWARYYSGVYQQIFPVVSEGVQMLNAPLVSTNSFSLVRAIVKLCQRGWIVDIIWVARSGNQAADALAKNADFSALDTIHLHTPPEFLGLSLVMMLLVFPLVPPNL